MRATIRWLCRMAESIAIIALIAATALIMTQIVAREIFVAGISWADELARYAGLTVIFMGVPALLARDEHVKVDMFLNMMPDRPRRFLSVMNDLLMVVFGAMFIYAGWLFLQRAARFSTPALGMPNLLFYMPAIVGMLLMLLVAVDRAVAALTGAQPPGPKDGAAP
jgi:TRAP-type transport system small permease protein